MKRWMKQALRWTARTLGLAILQQAAKGKQK